MGTNETIHHLSGHQGAIYDACWDTLAGRWLTAGGDGIVAEWAANGQGQGLALLHHDKAFFSISAHGATRAAGTENGELFLWETGKAENAKRIEAHRGGVFAMAWLGESQLVTGGGDERLIRWNATAIHQEWTMAESQKIRCITPSSSGIFVGTSEGRAFLCQELASANSIQKALELTGHKGGTYAAVWAADKDVWISGGRDGHLRVWQPNGRMVLAIPAHEGAIYRLVISRSTLWSASRDKTIKAWNLNDLSPLQRIERKDGGSNRSINALAIGGLHLETLLFGGDDRTAKLMRI